MKFRKNFGSAGVAFALVMSMVVATVGTLPPTPALAAGDEFNQISDGIGRLTDALAGLDGLDELANQIPFTNLLPTGNDALDLVDSLTEAIKDQLPAVPSFPTLTDLNDFLAADVNTLPAGKSLGNGVTAFIDMTATDSPYGLTIDLLKFEYTDTTAIDFQEGEITFEGGSVDTSFSLVLADTGNPLNLKLDTTLPTPALYIDAAEHAMTANFTVSAELSTTGFAARLGILDVTVGGTNAAGPDLSVAADFSLRILDPDGDNRITADEWASTAPLDLFDVDYLSSGATTALELNSTLNGLAGAANGTASITINDGDLSNGLQVEDGDIKLNLMSDFTNMSAQDVLATIRQLAISLTSLQIRTGNINLPFTNSTLAELVRVNDKILQFFQDIGISSSDNPLDFTIPDEFLETNGLATIEAILDELARTITGLATATASDLGIAYDPTGRVLTYDLQLANEAYVSPSPEPGDKTLGLDFADQLASVGVLGLETGVAASISVVPTYSVDLTVGLDLRDDATLGAAIGLPAAEDPILLDRIFLDTTGVEFSASAPLQANLELTGSIGILEVSLADSNAGGDVTLIGPRTDDSDPMLQVDIDGGSDNRVSLNDLFSALEADIALTPYEGPAPEPKDRGFKLFLDQADNAKDITILGLFNIAVPDITLNASASVGSTPLAGATITVGWADLLAAGSPTITTGGNFNTTLLDFQIDPENPLALFNQIVDVIDGTLGIVDGLLLNDSVLNEPLPLVDVSARDVVGFLGDLRDEVNALVSDPAGSLSELTKQLEAQVLDAIGLPAIPDVPNPFEYIKDGGVVVPPDDPAGVFDLAAFNADWGTFGTNLTTWQTDIEALLGSGGTFPTLPVPGDFVDPDLGFQLVDFLNALESFSGDLLTWVTDKSGFVDLEYVAAAGATPASLIIHLAIGICSNDQTDAACTVKRDLPATAFNFNLEDYLPSSDFGGLVAAEGSGEFAVSYKAVANIGLGLELPSVTPGASASNLPTVSGSVTPFILDDSGITLEANAGLETDFSARIGPFTVAVGDPGPATPESDAAGECDSGNTDDDDLDGFVNDGCPTKGSPDAVAEDQATQCDNATDDEDNDAATDGDQLDGFINDGCDAQGNPVVAKVGAMFTLENDITNPGTADRVYDFSAYAGGLNPILAPSSGADCGQGPKAACAVLPVYLNLSGGPEFLGEINFAIDSFDDPTPSLTGVPDIATELASNADALAWELIKQGLLTVQEFLDDATEASNYGESIPVVGDALDAGVEVAQVFNTRILTPVNTTLIPLLESYDTAGEVMEGLETFFWNQLYANSPSDTILLTRDASGDPNAIGDAPSGGSPTVEDFVNVVGICDTGAGEAPCAASDSTISIVDIQVQFAIGQAAAATTPPFDFGFPGLRLASDDPLTASVGWRLDVGFGLSFKDGFYLVTGDGGYIGDLAPGGFPGRDAEATISSSIDMPATMQGDLAFIQVNITEKDPEDVDDAAAMTLKEAANDAVPDSRDLAEATLNFEIDITGGGTDERVGLTELVGGADSLGFDPKLNGGIDVLVGLTTTVNLPELDSGSIPSLLAVLDLKWDFAASGAIEGGLDIGNLDASVDDVRIDLGSFISEFLAPVLGEVQRYTKPLQPVIDTVSAPIPGITELAALVGEPPVTLLSFFEAISDNDLTMIRRIIDLISFVNSIPTNPGEIIIDLGEFDINPAMLREPELPATEKGKLVENKVVATANVMDALATSSAPGVSAGFKTQLNKSRTGGGFSFPAFEDPTQLFGLLMGDNPTLIRWDAGLLKASMSFSRTFGPIAVGPIPVSLVISGAAGIEGRFAIGYDTKGIRQMVEVLTDGDDTNDGFFTSFGILFAGVFIDDLDAAGNDVPEITLFGELAAGAAVDLVIVSAGVEGGVRLTIDMNLHDGGFQNPPDPENLDGKLRIDEIVTYIYNPLCLFDVSGRIEAFIRVFVKIDLGFFSKTFRKTIVNIVLLNLKDITADLCAPPEPVLASNDDGVLVLNMGPRADQRNFAEDEEDEKFVVRQLGAGKVSVTAFGYYEEHPKPGEPAITKVFSDAGDGNDVVVMEAGAVPRLDPNGIVVTDVKGNPINDIIPFTINTTVCGGPGNDRLAGGGGVDTLVGDGAKGTGYTCTTADAATDGADEIGGLGGADNLYGTGNDDVITGDAGDDTIRGGTGNDQISGGFGRDTMYGGSGNDATDQAFIDLDADNRSDDDEILGGPEPDPGATTAADDRAFGGLGTDSIEGDVGNDELHGGPGIDIITGDAGNDDIFGDAGDDILFGNDDNDTIEGGAGNDDVHGNDGNDVLYGDDAAAAETGNDDIIGGEGNDEMHGGAGYDVMLGDEGNINRAPNAAPPFTPNDTEKPLIELTSINKPSVTDEMYGDGDPDRMWGQEGGDDMFGGGGDDEMHGNTGADEMHGNSGGDTMFGDSDTDTMYGDDDDPTTNVDGADTMRGGNDPDFMYGNAAGDTMFGDSGNDTMYGDDDDPTTSGDGADTMRGGIGDDLMFGNGSDDVMYGEADNDRMIGGSSTDGESDGADIMSGGAGTDVMTGDNATIADGATAAARLVTLLLDGKGTDDTMDGGDDGDRMFGQIGDDNMRGGDAPDYMEGNNGDDSMFGEDGNDDMIGGGSAFDGIVDGDRAGNDLDDTGETIMSGGPGTDWMAGDNALIDRNFDLGAPIALRLFDVATTTKAVGAGIGGGDTMEGDAGFDVMFGQGDGDTMYGDFGNNTSSDSGLAAGDYMEGNNGDDSMFGEDGNDDMMGGGSANDGRIVNDRAGTGLLDVGETLMSGGPGVDWMTGDNALVDRNFPSGAPAPIRLFDVNSPDEAAVSGGDTMQGDEGDDVMFGQGNGAQTAESDPPDGEDNDGDGAVDEDEGNAGWQGDTMYGGADDDYVEGNHGSDLIYGNGGNDDLIGGGSAIDGLYLPERLGNLLEDERDTVYGGDGQDVITGDNARINRGGDAQGPTTGLILPISEDREVLLFDVNSNIDSLSGGDFLSGGADDDLMFGQGNGSQSTDQADPLDGVDNDFDGREGPDSTEYDCADNGFDNDQGGAFADGLADGDDLECKNAIDEDTLWDGDIMLGDGGDDYMEGSHGADWMFGGADEDDMIGGGSAIDGAIVPTRDGTGLNDGPDVMHGEGEDDVMAGDNAWINRIAAGSDWQRITSIGLPGAVAGYGPYNQAVRVTNMFAGDADDDAHGNDYMTGGGGNDEMYGQLGHDFVLGNEGDDALVGDLGQVRANVIGDDPSDPDPETIATQSPRWEDTIYETGSMWWETELYAYDISDGGVGGNDTLLGYDGRDTAFGGPGDDVINGDGDGTEEVFDAENPEYTHITDVDAATADTDMLFGGDGGDAIWGGRDNDILFGGHDEDFLDVRPREATDNGRTGARFRVIPRDRPAWFTWAFPENFQDVDFIYGGWDADALQADQAANGPDPGDRLADWAGGYNVFYLCPAGYGDFTITRSGSPFVQRFIQDLAEASGAFDAASNGESGFRDVGFVFPSQRGQNSHPPHADHPGHFTCADYAGVGSGLAVAKIAEADAVPEGGSTTLDGSASSGYGAVTFNWYVNPFDVDNAGSATPTINAAGLDDGEVEIGLEVIDEDGAYGVAKTVVQVTNVAAAVALNTMTATVDDGSPASVAAGYADPGVLDTHTAVIDWGDGTVCDPAVHSECSIVGSDGSGTVSGSHTYAGLGTYEVSVTVTDDDDGTTTGILGNVEVVAPRVRGAGIWIDTETWPADPLAVAGVDYGRAEAIAVMQSGTRNERGGTLFRQVAAALLNAAHGTDTSCVDDALAAAQAWLIANPPGSGVKDNSQAWAEAEALWSTVRDYNAGLLCVPAA